MLRFILLRWFAIGSMIASIAAREAAADPPDILREYGFISSHTVVHVTGGPQNYNMDLSIAGKFGLVTGYDYEPSPTAQIPTLGPHAEFVDVKAILFNPRSAAPLPVPGWDLDKTLNLTGLNGTFSDPSQLEFTGVDGQRLPIKLDATLRGPLLHLTGTNYLPPICASCTPFIGYQVDALAYLKPYADFNLDGKVDNNDLRTIMSNIGLASGASFEQGDANGDGMVNGDDFLVWQRSLGAATNLSAFANSEIGPGTVPEPTTLVLAVAVFYLAAILTTRTCRCG